MVNTSNTWEWFLMKRYFISECVHFQYSNDCILNLYIYMIFLIKFVKEICLCSRKYLTFIFSYWRLSKREFSKFLSYLSEYSWNIIVEQFMYTKLIQKQTKFLLHKLIRKFQFPKKFSSYKIYFPAPSEDYCDSLYTSRCIVPSFFFFSFLFFFQTRKVSWTPANRSKLSSSRKHSRRLIAASPGKFN